MPGSRLLRGPIKTQQQISIVGGGFVGGASYRYARATVYALAIGLRCIAER